MARPTDADSAETHERILAAARDEVRSTIPRNGISMRKVAERAGVSLGTLQYYFETKAGLLEACLDAYHRRLQVLGGELIAHAARQPPDQIREFIEHAMRQSFRFVRAEKALIELRLLTNALQGELHPRRQHLFMKQVMSTGAKALAPKVGLDEIELRLTVQSLISMLLRMALLSPGERESLTGQKGADAEAIVEAHVVDAALRLLRPSDP